jgi:hypothetical protein
MQLIIIQKMFNNGMTYKCVSKYPVLKELQLIVTGALSLGEGGGVPAEGG